jgi:CheY-like chemotaxis protein
MATVHRAASRTDELPDMGVADAAERAQRARKHICCVNGSSVFLDVVRELLEDERYNITTTNFVPLTFDQIAVLQPDLLIIDVVVGIQAGWDLLEQLRDAAALRGIPVIVTSTSQALLERAEALAAPNGAKHYLAMPFDLDVLLGMVHDLIGSA